jgi:hypothetical protein
MSYHQIHYPQLLLRAGQSVRWQGGILIVFGEEFGVMDIEEIKR